MEGLDTRLTLNHFINVISDNFILENKYPKFKKKIQLPPEAERNALLGKDTHEKQTTSLWGCVLITSLQEWHLHADLIFCALSRSVLGVSEQK